MYFIVLKPFSIVERATNLVALVVICGLYACAGGGSTLNSDRIERAFGTYGVDILSEDSRQRTTSLYSTSGAMKTTRTYAVVDFQDGPEPAYAREHALIQSGQSIGATFRRSGWDIDKQNLFIGEVEVPIEYANIGALMRIDLPRALAIHVYLLNISKNDHSYRYGTITEIHHPDYLVLADLNEIYGEIIFDDSNRDTLHDFIGAPRP